MNGIVARHNKCEWLDKLTQKRNSKSTNVIEPQAEIITKHHVKLRHEQQLANAYNLNSLYIPLTSLNVQYFNK